jgi:hypothetical protein
MKTRIRKFLLVILGGICLFPLMHLAQGQQPQGDPKLTEVWQPVPPLVTPGLGNAPPSDAVVLFAGNDLSQWQQVDGAPAKWNIAEGAFSVSQRSR